MQIENLCDIYVPAYFLFILYGTIEIIAIVRVQHVYPLLLHKKSDTIDKHEFLHFYNLSTRKCNIFFYSEKCRKKFRRNYNICLFIIVFRIKSLIICIWKSWKFKIVFLENRYVWLVSLFWYRRITDVSLHVNIYKIHVDIYVYLLDVVKKYLSSNRIVLKIYAGGVLKNFPFPL